MIETYNYRFYHMFKVLTINEIFLSKLNHIKINILDFMPKGVGSKAMLISWFKEFFDKQND